jgi:aspartate beta-hydroxylase
MSIVRMGLRSVNGLLRRMTATLPRPAFYDIQTTRPELMRVTAAFPQIRQEALVLVGERDHLPTYNELDRAQTRIAGSTPKRWTVFFVDLFGFKPLKNRSRCPKTCEALEGIPNLLQAFFSILDPSKSIPEHEGPYAGYLRYHLGLVVPDDNPPSITVNGETYVWKEGEAILFDDSYPHRVDNQSTGVRIVLIIDVRRPMPFFADLVNRFATGVLARWAYGYGIYRKIAAEQAVA